VPEPATVFYGKIINRSSGQIYQLAEGSLIWTIVRSNGGALTLTGPLSALRNGEFSYRLDVPHQALGLGLETSAGAFPLTAQPVGCSHLEIRVNGVPARILPPGRQAFEISQTLRASTCRLDLEVGNPLGDTDGDGLPDWWENRFGLDDPNNDTDGDGWNNLAEFRAGSDPKRDDRVPSLATREIRAYADGTTVVMLRALDSDSAASDLTYTLTLAPPTGALHLRNAVADATHSDAALGVGAAFTQADVNRGRLVFVHPAGTSVAQTRFQVTLRDENPAHPTATGNVAVVFYRPANVALDAGLTLALAASPSTPPAVAGVSADEQQWVANYLLSKDLGYIICDASDEARNLDLTVPSSDLTPAQYQAQYLPNYGPDRRHVLVGGTGDDRLMGSMENDLIIGGRGHDTLRGNSGSDLFLLLSRDDGNDTLEDFAPAEGDVLDVSRLLAGASPWLTNYLRLTRAGTHSLLGINFNGSGSFTDMVITLRGGAWAQTNLTELVEGGSFLSGDKILTPRVSLVASVPLASENGPQAGEFRLTRSGAVDAALAVNLQITGSAQNGVDYTFIGSQVTFLPGERVVRVQVNPYVDAITELTEVVQIAVVSGQGYEPGALAVATVSIEDLAPQITIEALEPVAVKNGLVPGVLLVARAGILDRSVLVRLNVTGTASRGTDYDGVPNFINLLPGQTAALLEVTPKPAAVIAGGAEFVQVAIRADAAYKVMEPSAARVVLVEEQLTLPIWRARFFAGWPGDLSAFASADPGQTGIRNLQRYAFGLDPLAPQSSPGRPRFLVRDGHLTVVYRQPASVQDVQYVVEVSDDLVTWHAGDGYVEPFAEPEFADQAEMACYRVKRSMNEDRAMFMRVRVVYAP
jgi:hypothetical protein